MTAILNQMSEETLNFVAWYSGMQKEQIEKAFERWKIETEDKPKSECCGGLIYVTQFQKWCNSCGKCLGKR